MLVGRPDSAAAMLKAIAPVLESHLPAQHPERGDLALCMGMPYIPIDVEALAFSYLLNAREVFAANYREEDARTMHLDCLIATRLVVSDPADSDQAPSNSALTRARQVLAPHFPVLVYSRER